MKFSNKHILFIIIVFAAVLRLVNYFDIPFTHDEFSALFRLNFDDFSSLIEKGVKIDAHPAGIHVLLFYWSKLFGFDEWVIKLPFIIFGVLSVFLIHKIAVKWFNETVGLICSSYLASIQYTVMYSQIARPYISGLFFGLAMVYFLTLLIKDPKNKFNKNLIFFIVFSSLCSYNHHFSLLFASIVGISGLFFVSKQNLKKYLSAGLIIFLLYLPHLDIFFYQLNVGGIGGSEGWLEKPNYNFLVNFLVYIFNHSILSILTVISIVTYGFIISKKTYVFSKKYILFFCWFFLPFIIGYLYSIYVNPVLQFSVLIFSFSFIFFIIFGHFHQLKEKINLLIVIIILIVNISTLIIERKHYDLFYQSVYEQILIDFNTVKKKNPNALFIVDTHQKINNYFSKKLNLKSDFIDFNSFKSEKEFIRFLNKNNKADCLFFGCLSSNKPNTLSIISEYFPNIKWQKNYFGGTTFLFNKGKSNLKEISNLDFDKSTSNEWSNINPDRVKGLENKYYVFNSDNNWGPTFTESLHNLINNQNNFISVSIKVKSITSSDKALIVTSIENENTNVYWGSTTFNQFTEENQINKKWITIHHTIKLSDINLKPNNLKLKAYVWNKDGGDFKVDNFEIKLIDGNPKIYGLFEEI